MTIKQLSVFLENKTGRINDVARILGEHGINMYAFSMAETADFGILRMIVSDVEAAKRVLREAKFAVTLTDVVGINCPNTPGSLSPVLDILAREQVFIEYMYAFVGNNDMKAVVIIKVEDNKKAIQLLSDNGIQVLPAEKVYQI